MCLFYKSKIISNSHLEPDWAEATHRQNQKLFGARLLLLSTLVSEPGPPSQLYTQPPSHQPMPHRLVVLGRDDLHSIWIPDDQITVRAHGYSPLAWVQVEYLGSIGACHSHKLIFIHLSRGLLQYKSNVSVPVFRWMAALLISARFPSSEWPQRPRSTKVLSTSIQQAWGHMGSLNVTGQMGKLATWHRRDFWTALFFFP